MRELNTTEGQWFLMETNTGRSKIEGAEESMEGRRGGFFFHRTGRLGHPLQSPPGMFLWRLDTLDFCTEDLKLLLICRRLNNFDSFFGRLGT